MTPTASRLQVRLEDRMLWFRNQWLFKWHHIKGDRPVEIDTFDGRHATYSGLWFEGTPRDVYWVTITRGVRKEVDELFQWIDDSVRAYPQTTAEAAIDECAEMVSSFVGTLRHHVVEKDRILRGNGVEFPKAHDAGDWRSLSRDELIHRALDLKRALFPPVPSMSAVVAAEEDTARTAVGRAVRRNGAQVVLSIAALSVMVEERIAALEVERPNSPEEIARHDDELVQCVALRMTLQGLDNAVLAHKDKSETEHALEKEASVFSKGVQDWWEKRAVAICDSAAELAMFLSAVGVCAAVGAVPTVAVVVAGALFGRKSALGVLKELAKKMRSGSENG